MRATIHVFFFVVVVDTIATKTVLTNRIMGHGVFHNTYETLVGVFLVPTCCQFLAPCAPGTDMIFYPSTFIGLNDMPEFNKTHTTFFRIVTCFSCP